MFNLKRKNIHKDDKNDKDNKNTVNHSTVQQNVTQILHRKFIDNGAVGQIFGNRDCNICYTTLDLDNIVQSKPCGHTSCISCLVTYFDTSNKFDCYSCRQNINELFTTNNGNETIDNFLNKNNIDNKDNKNNIDSQQVFYTPIRRRTSNIYQSSSELYGISNTVLPSVLIENFSQLNQIRRENFIALFDIHPEVFLNKNLGNVYITAFEDANQQQSSTSDIIYIEDISGSMVNRLNNVKKGLISTIEKLENNNQRFTIILFDDHAYQLFPLQKITSLNKSSIINKVKSINVGGSTNYNSAFTLLLLILQDSVITGENRKKIVKFGSDGENIGTTNYNLINDIYEQFPNLIMYVISIGENVNASTHLIPILRERSYELGKYMHIPNIEEFERILLEIIGDNPDTYASNIEIRFKNVKPISLNAIEENDGSYLIKFPYLNIGGDINIAFTRNDNLLMLDPEIEYIFTKNDGSEIKGKFNKDNDKILPDSLTIFFSKKRIIDIEINNIISNNNSSNEEKKNLLDSLKTYITPDMMGYYYSDFLFEINRIIYSFENSDNNSQNLREEIIGSLRTDTTPMRSIARHASTLIHTQLSQMNIS